MAAETASAAPDFSGTEAVARNERLLLRLFALTRVAIVLQAAVSLGLSWQSVAHPLVVAFVVSGIAGENVAVIYAHWRRGGLTSRVLAVADIGAGLAALVFVSAVIKASASPGSTNVLYPYTVATLIAAGLAFRKLSSVLAVAAAAVIVYLADMDWRFGFTARVPPDSLTYWAWAVLSWVLAARFRGLSAELDKALRTAVERERELAAERERMRYAAELHAVRVAGAQRLVEQERERARISRDLHDRVLQTLEFVGRETCINDAQVRDHVAAEAVWLRALVRGELTPAAGGLASALDEVVAAATDAGLHIEANMARLRGGPAAPEITAAVSGAVTELLTNVRKHAGTTRAVLRAVCEAGEVVVTILDHGCGFDPMRAANGIGLRESVMARIRQVNGRVVITSEPGAGTHVEICVPVAGFNGGGPAAPAAACPENTWHAPGLAASENVT